jgi:hypothetical protein
MITLTREEAHQLLVALQELNRLSIGENAICLPAEIDDAMEVLEARLAQPESDIVQDAVVYGTGIAKDGKRIDPASIYKEPEPVAVWELQEGGWDTIADQDWMESLPIGTKLYTAPPQREWQGLTLQEIEYIESMTLDRHDAIRLAAVALQEKNSAT